jgi:hypothetical protein
LTDRRRVAITLAILLLVLLAGTVSYLVIVRPSTNPRGPVLPGSAVCTKSSGNATSANWTTYHRDTSRSGLEPSKIITAVTPQWSGPVAVDGQVYAEPLMCGDSVFVATEGDSVYAVNATTGRIQWQTHLGTPVPGPSLPCGNIDPSGITGTPVIDAAAGTLYVVAFLTPDQHVLFGLNVVNGSIRSQMVVDPVGADPSVHQQRGALSLANGFVYVPFGGLYGDCGAYHGWVVGVPTSGSGGVLVYQVPSHREAGIWSPPGVSVAGNGNLYFSTGNGDSSTTFDYGNSVIELSASLNPIGYFAPTNWAQLNAGDTDLGSVAPTLLPNGDVFAIGKEGVGYLLSGSALGGIGGQLASGNVCGGAYGGTARVGLSIFVPCVDGLFDVVASASNLTVLWKTASFDAGSPIVTGNVVWVVDVSSSHLLGFNLTTGQPLYNFPLGSVDHFISPAAGDGSVVIAAGSQLYSFALT